MDAIPFKRRYDQVFPEDEQAATAADLTSIENRLMPRLSHVEAVDKKRMTRLGTGSFGWVNLCFGYGSRNPQFKQGFLDMAAWERDLDAIAYLTPLKQRVDKLAAALQDTLILLGFQAYEAARMFHAALKSAVASRQPGAAAIYADLARHYDNRATAFIAAADPSLAPAAPPATGSRGEAEFESEAEILSFFEPPAMNE